MWEESTPEPVLKIEDTERSFDFWLNRPFIPATLRGQLSRANVLLVPTEGYRDFDGPVFPEGTEQLLDYLRNDCPDGASVDICIDDDEYRELVIHDAIVVISSMIVSSVVCPLIVNRIQRYLDRRRSSDQTHVKVRITEVEGGKAREITYEGPFAGFEPTLRPILGSGSSSAADAEPTKDALESGTTDPDADGSDPGSTATCRR